MVDQAMNQGFMVNRHIQYAGKDKRYKNAQ